MHREGDRGNGKNYRWMTLLNPANKILSGIIQKCITAYAEETIGDYQCGLRPNRSTVAQIFSIPQHLEKNYEFNQGIHRFPPDL